MKGHEFKPFDTSVPKSLYENVLKKSSEKDAVIKNLISKIKILETKLKDSIPKKEYELLKLKLDENTKKKQIQIYDSNTHLGRAPILSPFLGEVYLSLGRFEEALEVFKKLLKKEPKNQRYKKKIEDLERIIKP